MSDCVEAGTRVFTADGKFLTFDPAATRKRSRRSRLRKKDTLKVRSPGKQSGDTLKVTAIKIL